MLGISGASRASCFGSLLGVTKEPRSRVVLALHFRAQVSVCRAGFRDSTTPSSTIVHPSALRFKLVSSELCRRLCISSRLQLASFSPKLCADTLLHICLATAFVVARVGVLSLPLDHRALLARGCIRIALHLRCAAFSGWIASWQRACVVSTSCFLSCVASACHCSTSSRNTLTLLGCQ
jgi:hypothetical protein